MDREVLICGSKCCSLEFVDMAALQLRECGCLGAVIGSPFLSVCD